MQDPVLFAIEQRLASLTSQEQGEVRLFWLTLPSDEALEQPGMKQNWFDQSVLSTEEISRAAKFRQDIDQLRFICGRKILRGVLSTILNRQPRDIPLSIIDGRPNLSRADGEDIQFNISHSGQVVIVGFARGTEIGVDVEVNRRLSDLMAIAKRVMTEQEYAEFLLLKPDARQSAFYKLWVAKEAILKYWGTGFRKAPDTVHIGISNLTPEKWTPTESIDVQLSGNEVVPYHSAVAVSKQRVMKPPVFIFLGQENA